MSKESLLQVSTSLFMKFGIKSVSMDDIANELGMSKKTIYTYIDNKDELVLETLQAFMAQEKLIINRITADSKNAVDEMAGIARYIMQMFRMMKPTLTFDLKKYHSRAWNFLNEDHFPFIELVIQNNLKRGKQEMFYRHEIDENLLAKVYVSQARLMVDEDVFPISQFERSYLYENFICYHLNGIINDKGRKEFRKYQKQEIIE